MPLLAIVDRMRAILAAHPEEPPAGTNRSPRGEYAYRRYFFLKGVATLGFMKEDIAWLVRYPKTFREGTLTFDRF